MVEVGSGPKCSAPESQALKHYSLAYLISSEKVLRLSYTHEGTDAHVSSHLFIMFFIHSLIHSFTYSLRIF